MHVAILYNDLFITSIRTYFCGSPCTDTGFGI